MTIADAQRITPAHAGKSVEGGFKCWVHWDHPRTRGEKVHICVAPVALTGSPPHTRGKVLRVCRISPEARITPAHAGKSFDVVGVGVVGEGSPPHTRGKVVVAVRISAYDRITPAHAGKSLRNRGDRDVRKDHPRTRGEKLFFGFGFDVVIGSPPHTRGKADIRFHTHRHRGITPAHAGKRTGKIERKYMAQDHPRTRGEKYTGRLLTVNGGGSPPHTRGKVNTCFTKDKKSRITPAHAGKRFINSRLQRES